MVLAKRDFDRPVAPVAASWKRIEAWLEEHYQPMFAALRPGVTEAEIKRLEKACGFSLPEDVKESYRIHDAHDHAGEGNRDLFFCNLPLAEKYGSVLTEWKSWHDLRRTSPDTVEQIEGYGRQRSVPEGSVRPAYTVPGWVPLESDYGGNHLGVDLEPGPKGRVGQVINFGKDEKVKYVLAHSWGRFLEDIADEMEAGNFYLEESEGSIWLRKPKREPLYTQYRAWHKAKAGT